MLCLVRVLSSVEGHDRVTLWSRVGTVASYRSDTRAEWYRVLDLGKTLVLLHDGEASR